MYSTNSFSNMLPVMTPYDSRVQPGFGGFPGAGRVQPGFGGFPGAGRVQPGFGGFPGAGRFQPGGGGGRLAPPFSRGPSNPMLPRHIHGGSPFLPQGLNGRDIVVVFSPPSSGFGHAHQHFGGMGGFGGSQLQGTPIGFGVTTVY